MCKRTRTPPPTPSALLAAMEYLEDHLGDWLGEELAGYGDEDYLVLDCPGGGLLDCWTVRAAGCGRGLFGPHLCSQNQALDSGGWAARRRPGWWRGLKRRDAPPADGPRRRPDRAVQPRRRVPLAGRLPEGRRLGGVRGLLPGRPLHHRGAKVHRRRHAGAASPPTQPQPTHPPARQGAAPPPLPLPRGSWSARAPPLSAGRGHAHARAAFRRDAARSARAARLRSCAARLTPCGRRPPAQALAAMVKLELPHINLLTKMDL
jgi:hypothetical protein